MPSRVVRGEINRSESLSRVSANAELTFRALLTEVDDYGRFDARPKALKAALFPFRDGFTAAKIFTWVMELHAEGCVQVYEVDGRAYLQMTNWERHRGIGRRAGKSRYPEPSAASEKSPEILGSDRRSAFLSGDEGREARIEGRGTYVESVRGTPGACAPARSNRSKPVRSLAPDDLDPEQKVALLAWVREKHPALEPRIRELVDACLDHHRSRGNAMADWVATCRTWIRKSQQFGVGPRGSPAERQDARAELLVENMRAAARLAERRAPNEQHRRESVPAGADVRQLRAGGEPLAN